MNLAYKYPIIYWNTANLIVDSGGEGSSTDYRKIAQSVNRIRQAGIEVSLVDINRSALDFKPDEEHNRIMYGLKALTNINDDFVKEIENGRPYVSLVDFVTRINPKKPAMLSLIKGGAFDELVPRQEAMVQYLWLKCDKKKNLTLQNMPGLIRYGFLPKGEEYLEGRRVYEFNRYLKAECKNPDGNYLLTPRAIDFLEEVGYDSLIEPGLILNAKSWDNVYQERMDLFRDWIKENKEELLRELNTTIFMQDWEKYASGNISSWEMEALCFYYHEHELARLDTAKYGISDFFKLSENPIVEKTFKRGDAIIPIYRLFKICGTCIAKNKDKSTVYILTTSGVVPVKFRKEYFSIFDRQIFKKNPDRSKTILERSWYNRGNMIMVQGIRRGDEFVSKKYARSGGHQLYHIDEIAEDGTIVLRSERKQGEEEEDDNDN